MTEEEAKTIIKEYLYNHRFGYIAKDAEFDRLYEAMKVAIQELEQESCKVSEYDKDHIWYKGCQYISLRRFLEVKAETEQEPTDENLHREREQAYMQGYEDACKKYRQEPKIGHWITEIKSDLRRKRR